MNEGALPRTSDDNINIPAQGFPTELTRLIAQHSNLVTLGNIERHQISSNTLKCDQCGERSADWFARLSKASPCIVTCSDPACLQKANKAMSPSIVQSS